MGYQSNSNAMLYNGCEPLQNLAVQLRVGDPLVTQEGAGFSLQMNTYAVTGQTCQGMPVNWLQYIIYVLNDQFWYEVQYWAIGSSTWPPGYTHVPGTSPWLPCWANDDEIFSFASAPNNQVPSGYSLQIALTTDAYSRVVSANFSVTDDNGKVSQATFNVPQNAQFQICACEVDLVGPGNSANCTFNTGNAGSSGILYYSVNPGTLSVQSAGPGSACGEVGDTTAETSNMVYGTVSPSTGSNLSQAIGPLATCSIDNLVAQAKTPQATAVGNSLRRVRDEQMRQLSSGQWLIELFTRNTAEIWNLFNEDPKLLADGWELLQKAESAISAHKPFSAELIDAAQALVERGAAKATRDLAGQVAPFVGVLNALRGDTFEEGLKKASKTIHPRYPNSRGLNPAK